MRTFIEVHDVFRACGIVSRGFPLANDQTALFILRRTAIGIKCKDGVVLVSSTHFISCAELLTTAAE